MHSARPLTENVGAAPTVAPWVQLLWSFGFLFGALLLARWLPLWEHSLGARVALILAAASVSIAVGVGAIQLLLYRRQSSATVLVLGCLFAVLCLTVLAAYFVLNRAQYQSHAPLAEISVILWVLSLGAGIAAVASHRKLAAQSAG